MIDLNALKTEIETDPAPMGYPAFTAANDVAIADILNNKNGDKTRTVDKDEIMVSDFVAATTFNAYDGLTAAETAFFDMQTSRDTMAVTDDTKQNWAGLPTANGSLWATGERTLMEGRIAALMQRDGSRAEEIRKTLGADFVTPSNVADARQLP